MRRILAIVVLALAACSPPAAEQDAASPPEIAVADNCPASASSQWNTGNQVVAVEAVAGGEACASAHATLTFRDAEGATLYEETFEAQHVMVLAGAESVDDMRRRLNEWISPPGAAPDSTRDLPEWAAGAESPMQGEFPFYPEEGLTRTAYEALRTLDAPMFCFVQGMESQACLTMQSGALRKIGVQAFPG
jgi:hypothetical protein